MKKLTIKYTCYASSFNYTGAGYAVFPGEECDLEEVEKKKVCGVEAFIVTHRANPGWTCYLPAYCGEVVEG